ncbi:hypothetical protein BDW22DRAFT_1064782 [Trametopsis cervina]|nr:hypothetical protein BDW22DRAFT_1064782 [Trametopsis cervina]
MEGEVQRKQHKLYRVRLKSVTPLLPDHLLIVMVEPYSSSDMDIRGFISSEQQKVIGVLECELNFGQRESNVMWHWDIREVGTDPTWYNSKANITDEHEDASENEHDNNDKNEDASENRDDNNSENEEKGEGNEEDAGYPEQKRTLSNDQLRCLRRRRREEDSANKVVNLEHDLTPEACGSFRGHTGGRPSARTYPVRISSSSQPSSASQIQAQ